MMGILNPKPINIPPFIPPQISISDNDVNFKKHQLNQLVAYNQITPPEFSQINETYPTHYSVVSFRRHKILEQVAQKQMFPGSIYRILSD